MPIQIVDPNPLVVQPSTSETFQYAGYTGRLANGSTHHFTDTEMRTLHNMLTKWSTTNGLTETLAMDNFNRFYAIFPDMEMPADLKTYVFITRPELNLLGDSDGGYASSGKASEMLSADNFGDDRLKYLWMNNPEIVYMLTEGFSYDHDFIPYLQGRTESLQLPDYQIRTSDFTIPFYSYKYTYPTVTNESITGGQFDITFREDEDLRITKLFQFWIYYMDAVIKNKMKVSRQHLVSNTYDFMCSVYEIICDPTSEKVLYYAKYTGCYPIAVPVSNLSHNLRSNVENKVSISFNYMMVECLEPRIVEDFNNNSRARSGEAFVDIYNETYGMVTDALVGNPYLETTTDEHGLKLKWYPRSVGRIGNMSKRRPTLTNYQTAVTNSNAYRSQVTNSRNQTGINTTYRYTGSRSPNTTKSLSDYLTNNSDRNR